jgi:hypothetical protein
MPKNESDPEDPLELNGVALLTAEDTHGDMAACFVEEFLRLGHGARQILAFFRNPHYVGPHLVLRERGEDFVRAIIVEIFHGFGRGCDLGEVGATPAPGPPPSTPATGDFGSDDGSRASTPLDPMGCPTPDLRL